MTFHCLRRSDYQNLSMSYDRLTTWPSSFKVLPQNLAHPNPKPPADQRGWAGGLGNGPRACWAFHRKCNCGKEKTSQHPSTHVYIYQSTGSNCSSANHSRPVQHQYRYDHVLGGTFYESLQVLRVFVVLNDVYARHVPRCVRALLRTREGP